MRTAVSLPLEVEQAIQKLGENIRLARVRRRMSQEELAKACQITRKTLYSIETGVPGIAIGTLLSVLWALGLLDSARHVADPENDEHGKVLETARQPKRVHPSPGIDNDF